jgi:hypothetical protein
MTPFSKPSSPRERRHAEKAIAAAEKAGLFSSEIRSWIIGKTMRRVRPLLANQVPHRERRHAEKAIAAAEEAGFFSSEIRSWIIDPDKRLETLKPADIHRLLRWNSNARGYSAPKRSRPFDARYSTEIAGVTLLQGSCIYQQTIII